MADKYLKIAQTGDNIGTVVNIVMMEDTDVFDPDFKWTVVDPDVPTGVGKSVNIDPTPVTTGDKDTFDAWRMSDASGGYTVSFDGTNINIDCVILDMKWLRAELTDLCKNKKDVGTLTYGLRSGVLFDGRIIAWDDVNKLLTILETLK